MELKKDPNVHAVYFKRSEESGKVIYPSFVTRSDDIKRRGFILVDGEAGGKAILPRPATIYQAKRNDRNKLSKAIIFTIIVLRIVQQILLLAFIKPFSGGEPMKSINNINQLKLPDIYKETLMYMLNKLQNYPVVKDVILFGSCAREKVRDGSDIDLALIISEPITPQDEWDIDFSIRNWDTMLPCDVIFLREHLFDMEIKGETIIRLILQEGVRLSGLLY